MRSAPRRETCTRGRDAAAGDGIGHILAARGDAGAAGGIIVVRDLQGPRPSPPEHCHRDKAEGTDPMCGIVALFSRRAPISEDVLERATKRLYHRGPDGQRHWIS